MWFKFKDTPYTYLKRVKQEMYLYSSILQLYKNEMKSDANLVDVSEIEEHINKAITALEREVNNARKFNHLHGGERVDE